MPCHKISPTARGHERRCKALRYRAKDPLTGERIQCAKWALRGGDYCLYHQTQRDRRSRGGKASCSLGNVPSSDGDVSGEEYATVPAGYMNLSHTLRQRLAELEGTSPADMIDLTEELKLAKATMGDVQQLYDLTLLALEHAPDDKQLEMLRQVIVVGSMLRETASEIGEVAGKAAGAMAACRHFLGIQNIPVLVKQMVDIMYDELGDENAMTVARIAERFKDVRMPSEGPRGTRITPEMADDEARMMDSSVPLIEHDSGHDEDAA